MRNIFTYKNDKQLKFLSYLVYFMIILILLIMLSTACSMNHQKEQPEQSNHKITDSITPIEQTGFYFDTVCTIGIYDMENFNEENALAEIEHIFNLCEEYDLLFSMTNINSDVYRINHAEGKTVKVDPLTVELIKKGIIYGDLSDGMFDITIGGVSTLWDFHNVENPKLPDDEILKDALPHIDYKNINIINETEVQLKDPKAKIDLGGIAKGYIADLIYKELKKDEVISAMINLGGNLACIGKKPGQDYFTAGIRLPFSDKEEIIGTTLLNDETLVTSGIYERYFKIDDVLYHHILNPETGYPFDTDVLSVTIKSKAGQSADCDALSTICLSLGVQKGKELIESLDGYEAAFIDLDNQIILTSGMELNAIE